jgi:hypothetical protein
MAAGTGLTQNLFCNRFGVAKRQSAKAGCHSEFPYHAFAHCKGFAPAASRRTRTLVSVSFSGRQLPLPLLIIGLVSRYLTNYLIRSSLILRRNRCNFRRIFSAKHSSIGGASGIDLSFPRLYPSLGQIDYLLLSRTPSGEAAGQICMA